MRNVNLKLFLTFSLLLIAFLSHFGISVNANPEVIHVPTGYSSTQETSGVVNQEDTKVDLLSHTGYLDAFGLYHVVGEVKNDGSVPVESVRVNVTFYDSDDAFVASSRAYIMIDVILVGRKAPFDVALASFEKSARVDHYDLNVTFAPCPGGKPLGLLITSNSSQIEPSEYLHIFGEIKNLAQNATADRVKVVATCYDDEGNVVAARWSSSSPANLEPNQTAHFDIYIIPERVLLVAYYGLTAESDQYSLIPEFPPFMILPVFSIATVLAIILRRNVAALRRQ